MQMKMFVVRLLLNYDFKESEENPSKLPADDLKREPFDTIETKDTLFNMPLSGMNFIMERINVAN